MSIQHTFAQALQHHQAGRLMEAEALYRQVLLAKPKHADALHLLGLIAGQRGELELSAGLIGKAVAIQPDVAQYQANLGETYRRLDKFKEAIRCFNRAIQLNGKSPEVYNNLGLALKSLGELDQAIANCRKAIALRPDYPEAHYNLGLALDAKGNLEDAVASYQRAIELKPNYFEAHNNLGLTLKKLDRLEAAKASLRTAISLNPAFPNAYNNLGVILRESGRCDEAIAHYQTAIHLQPDYADAYANLSGALIEKGQLDEALIEIQRALAIDPNHPEAHSSLVLIYQERGQPDEALATCKRAMELIADPVEGHNTMGNLHKDMGDFDQALACYQKALTLSPDAHRIHSNYVYTLHFPGNVEPAKLLEEHRRWARAHAEPLKSDIDVHTNDADPNRRLKIAFISPDLRAHPVGRFLLPLFANHDHANYEIFCYASVSRPDPITDRLRAGADVWRDILTLSDAEVADQIRADKIDILIDVTMHMAFNRLLVFARKPAPVQATYLAYASTTGLETIDYRITDPYLDPPGSSDAFYSEKSIRLANTYWCYEPVLDGLTITPPPSEKSGQITFGCFNNFCKITPQTLDAWMQILKCVPNSILRLHAGTGSHRQRMRDTLRDNGIDPLRLEFVGKVGLLEYMKQYDQIDIALDPFPYVGGTTTCDAIWMGVPVVTLSGETAISRGGASILHNLKCPELIASDIAHYVRIATDLAADFPRLADMRSTLRDRMLKSPLMDGPRFARSMEAAYHQMWREWCQKQVNSS